jgi:VanZ family protein
MKAFSNMMGSCWTYRVMALVWMGVIFWLSSKQSLPAPDLFRGQDKVEHAAVFGILALFFALSFKEKKREAFGKRVLTVTLLAILYGFSDELHQYFVPGRNPSLWDLCADGAGGFLAAYFSLRTRGNRSS